MKNNSRLWRIVNGIVLLSFVLQSSFPAPLIAETAEINPEQFINSQTPTISADYAQTTQTSSLRPAKASSLDFLTDGPLSHVTSSDLVPTEEPSESSPETNAAPIPGLMTELTLSSLNFTDETGHQNNGTGSGTFSLSSDVPPGSSSTSSLQFNGANTSVALPPSLIQSKTTLSVATWFKTTSSGGIFGYQNVAVGNNATNWVPVLYVDDQGKLRGEFWQGNVNPITSAASVTDGKWHHVALTANGNTQSLYLDGQLVGTLSGTINHLDMTFNQIGVVRSKFWSGSSSDWPFFNGKLSDFMVADHALTSSEINSIIQGNQPGDTTPPVVSAINASSVLGSGITGVVTGMPLDSLNPLDTSMNHNDGTAAGNFSLIGDVPPGASTSNSLLFNGTNTSVSLPQSLVQNKTSLSIATWFKTTGSGGIFGYQNVSTSGTPTNWVPVLYVDAQGKLRSELWQGNVNPITSSLSVTDGNWHHAALIANGNTQSLYLDGQLVGTLAGTINNLDMRYNQIGVVRSKFWPSSASDWSFFNGELSNFLMADHALSASELSSLIQGNQPKAIISWITDEASNSQVEYGLTSAYGALSTLDSNLVTSHNLTLSGLTPNTLYHYRVRSRDAAGNLVLSNDFTFTTPSNSTDTTAPIVSTITSSNVLGTAISGVMTEISMDSLTPIDSSLNHNDGIPSGNFSLSGDVPPGSSATTSLIFNGINSSVSLPQTLVQNTTALSIATWFKTTGSGGIFGYQNVSTSGTPTNWVPVIYVDAQGKLRSELWQGGVNPITTGAAVNDGQWHHVVLVANGNTQSLYLDGQLVGTLSGIITHLDMRYNQIGVVRSKFWPSSANDWSFFNGKLSDFVMVNHAMNAAEINSLIQGNQPKIKISWATDEASSSQVEYGLTTAYGTMSALDSTLVSNHNLTLTGLSPNSLYHYRVHSRDAAGNLTLSDDFTFMTPTSSNDMTSPLVSAVTPSGITGTGATISWTTDEFSDTQIQYGTTTGYGSVTALNASYVKNHSQTLSNLNSQTLYHYRVLSRDVAGNLTTSQDFTFTTLDITAPALSAINGGNLTRTSSTITWTTNEVSDTQVEYGLDTNYGNSSALDASLTLNHSVSIAQLQPGTLYHYRVRSRDGAGNLQISGDFSFTTTANGVPVISNLSANQPDVDGVTPGTQFYPNTNVTYNVTASDPDNDSLLVQWSYRINNGAWTNFTTGLSASFTYAVSDIGKTYDWRATVSDPYTQTVQIITANIISQSSGDTTPPVLAGIQILNVTGDQATLSWTTNENADSQIEFGLTSSYGNSFSDTSLGLNHNLSLTGLQANTNYNYRVVSRDAAGNITNSANFTFTTASIATTPATLFLNFAGGFVPNWGGWNNISLAAFSGGAAAMAAILAGVTEKYSPFNVNVTGVDPFAPTQTYANETDLANAKYAYYQANRIQEIYITPSYGWYGSAGGVAYVGTFYNLIVNTAFVFSDLLGNSADYVTVAAAHEAGHTFGLQHQSQYDANGNLVATYYGGANGVAPVMGLGYYVRNQWWYGTTFSAQSFQDDITVLGSSFNSFGLRADEAGDAENSAAAFTDVLGTSLGAHGVITTSQDKDYYEFTTTQSGNVSFSASTASFQAMLDLDLEIRDVNGNLVTSRDTGSLGESISNYFLTAGKYYLVVKSHGLYGDVGQYIIDGTVPIGTNTTAGPNAVATHGYLMNGSSNRLSTPSSATLVGEDFVPNFEEDVHEIDLPMGFNLSNGISLENGFALENEQPAAKFSDEEEIISDTKLSDVSFQQPLTFENLMNEMMPLIQKSTSTMGAMPLVQKNIKEQEAKDTPSAWEDFVSKVETGTEVSQNQLGETKAAQMILSKEVRAAVEKVMAKMLGLPGNLSLLVSFILEQEKGLSKTK